MRGGPRAYGAEILGKGNPANTTRRIVSAKAVRSIVGERNVTEDVQSALTDNRRKFVVEKSSEKSH
jgi:hypothetical protein